MATKDKGKKRILENQLMFEFFGELDTVIKQKKKQEKVKVEIEKQKKPKAIKKIILRDIETPK